VLLASLLVLPVLVYITTSTLDSWRRQHSAFSYPQVPVQQFLGRLERSKITLPQDQARQLRKIFVEEFARANQDLGETQTDENRSKLQSEELKACYARIRPRVQSLLDESTFDRYQSFEKRKLEESERAASLPVWSRTGAFYHWLLDLYFFVVLPLNCVRLCGGLIRDELQADTLGFLLTRPLSRARLVVLKYLSQIAWLQILALTEGLLLFAAGGLRHVPSLGVLLPLFLGAQVLAVFAWGALGAFLGQVTQRYMPLALVYGFIIELGIGRIPTNINTLSMMRHLKTILSRNPALQSFYDWPASSLPLSILALVVAAVFFLGLAALLFTVKEYHHTAEMQK
jgi:ABC-type Na+ efflux pump permease subunit